ncbi:unnamed protein product [Kuraishia capsulata CBS 1993]|uniref:Fe2OG dioxygenase domain-containing protein n=1 Tax=Kuraishia capsulata CBS 1993 TaxID=1382522 RepID=W6MJ95_9ASCO|nr:uncharacterized protein KUCA_T00002562001 [Kuraishia capsulata CBS 1993]CDK26589.1 unnamed protein product [Kuraishia capsulata CBS 1993]
MAPVPSELSYVPASYEELSPFHEAPVLDQSTIDKYPVVHLDAIDLSQYVEGPEGLPARQKLAAQLEESISTSGFFNLINTGYDADKIERLKTIAINLLNIPQEEKMQYLAGAITSDDEDRTKSLGGERGAGFKPRGYWSFAKGVRDAIEHYNFRNLLHDDIFLSPEAISKLPAIVRPYVTEIQAYYQHLHYDVLKKISALSDIILELPEGTLYEMFEVKQNDLQNSGGGFGRFMRYHKMDPEDEAKVQKNWLRGHSDSTTFTMITSQPILSLQIRDYDTGEWKFVAHRPNSLVVNIGDALEFLTGSYFKSSIHRVVAPPEEQKDYTRLVLIYFQQPKAGTIVDPETLNSPKLNRLGLTKPAEWEKIDFFTWDDSKGRLYGQKAVNDTDGDEPLSVLLYGRLHERWHQRDKQEEVGVIRDYQV